MGELGEGDTLVVGRGQCERRWWVRDFRENGLGSGIDYKKSDWEGERWGVGATMGLREGESDWEGERGETVI